MDEAYLIIEAAKISANSIEQKFDAIGKKDPVYDIISKSSNMSVSSEHPDLRTG